ncbi:MAG: periplasmic heavy metal sensor [Spirochaetales bacterium]|nr:periplasmic heavy metal sensor [Spirochaetales bacterium]
MIQKISTGAIALLLLFTAANCRSYRPQQGAERILCKLDRRVKSLNLSPEQNERYQSIRSRLKVDIEAHQAARNGVLRELKQEFEKENPDVAAQTAGIKRAMQERQSAFLKLPDYYSEFYSILDDAQKSEINEKIRKKLRRIELPQE